MSNVQYITDANGHRTAVIVPIREYEDLLNDQDESPAQEQELDDKLGRILDEESKDTSRASRDEVLAALNRD